MYRIVAFSKIFFFVSLALSFSDNQLNQVLYRLFPLDFVLLKAHLLILYDTVQTSMSVCRLHSIILCTLMLQALILSVPVH